MNRLSRRVTAILVLVIGLKSTSLAQVHLSIGLHSGIDLANAIVDPELFQTSSRTGFMVGAVLEVEIVGPLVVQVEPTYCQKGAKLSSTPTLDVDTQSGTVAKYSYFEIPVLLKVNLRSSKFKPYIFTGPNLGIRLSSQFESQVGGETITQDMEGQTESRDFVWDFGAGASYDVTQVISITADVRYSLGLTDVDNSSTFSWRSRDSKILAGVLFTP